jgi:cytochrome c
MTSTPRKIAALLLATTPLWSLAASDETMLKLASTSGCLTCHQVQPGAPGPNGGPPVGPAWRSVAVKYKGRAGAAAELTRTVMTGSSLYASHWKGEVSGVAMPPNAVAITEPNARALVGWILTLDNQK